MSRGHRRTRHALVGDSPAVASAAATHSELNTEWLVHLSIHMPLGDGGIDDELHELVRAALGPRELRVALHAVAALAEAHPDDSRLRTAYVRLLGACALGDHAAPEA